MKKFLDCKGLECPQPVIKVFLEANKLPTGTVLEVHADCPTFESDIRKWCEEHGKVLMNMVDHGDYKEAVIQL